MCVCVRAYLSAECTDGIKQSVDDKVIRGPHSFTDTKTKLGLVVRMLCCCNAFKHTAQIDEEMNWSFLLTFSQAQRPRKCTEEHFKRLTHWYPIGKGITIH